MEKGAVGIGTLIVFIAMVLVAAVASVVLLHTAGTLQERGFEVGKKSTSEVSSKIIIEDVKGFSSVTDKINALVITAKLSSGALPISLNYTTLSYQSENLYVSGVKLNATGGRPSACSRLIFAGPNAKGWILNTSSLLNDTIDCLCYNVTSAGTNWYAIRYLQTIKGKQPDVMLEAGEVVEIIFCIGDELGNLQPLGTDTDWRVKLIPKDGTSTEAGGTTPSSIQTTWVSLYP